MSWSSSWRGFLRKDNCAQAWQKWLGVKAAEGIQSREQHVLRLRGLSLEAVEKTFWQRNWGTKGRPETEDPELKQELHSRAFSVVSQIPGARLWQFAAVGAPQPSATHSPLGFLIPAFLADDFLSSSSP